MSESSAPTPYPEVNALLAALLAGLREVLGERLVGLYLYGSLSLGDFDPASSDVDFLAVTEGELPEAVIEGLRAMHARLAASGLPYCTYLEGSYIPRAAWRRYDPANRTHPTIGVDWPLMLAVHGSNWIIERHIVRERGVVVAGPPPRTLTDPVPPAALCEAVCAQLPFWRERVDDVDFLAPRNYQAFAVLTLCRALATLRRGDVCSKPQAAAWASAAYPAWAPIISRALAWRSDHTPADASALAETQAFLRAALAEAATHCGSGTL